jgi:hypothetical protein
MARAILGHLTDKRSDGSPSIPGSGPKRRSAVPAVQQWPPGWNGEPILTSPWVATLGPLPEPGRWIRRNRLKGEVTQTTESTTSALPPAGAEGIRESLRAKFVCPFCGSVNDNEQGTCPRCTMENSAATRKATKTRIGPWYVLQTRNPAAPGMTWETLIGFIRKGRVKPRSIVRGPTTHQLWRFAAHVKGLSREFGICYSCGANVEPTASLCPTCNRLQDPPPNPDALLEASREGQQTYATPPATIDGTVLAGAGTMMSQIPGAAAAEPPAPPPPDDAEFVIPALGGFTTGEGPLAAPPSEPAYAPAPAAAAAPAIDPLRGVTPASAGPATPPSNFQGISGDPSWAKIGGGAEAGRNRGGAAPVAQRPAAGKPVNGATNPAPSKFNPYADDDLPSATPGRREGEGFLSAKDLAAAFNLGFVGEEEDEDQRPAAAGGRGRGGAATAGRAKAAAGSRDPVTLAGLPGMGIPGYPPVGSGRGKLKITLAILVLAIMGFGVALAVSSDLRQAVKKWFSGMTAGLNKQGDSDQLGSPGSNRRKLDGPGKRPAEAEPDTRGSHNAAPPATNPTGDAENGGPPATPASATRPAEVRTPAPPAIPSSVAVPPVAPPQTRPIAPPTEHVSIPATAPAVSWAQSEVAKLYREAVAKEVTDAPLAMSRYKEIRRRFPPDTWPSDLDTRMKRMEERLKKLAGG